MKRLRKLLLLVVMGMFLIGAKAAEPAAPGLNFESFDLVAIEELLADMGFVYTPDPEPFEVVEIFEDKGYSFRPYALEEAENPELGDMTLIVDDQDLVVSIEFIPEYAEDFMDLGAFVNNEDLTLQEGIEISEELDGQAEIFHNEDRSVAATVSNNTIALINIADFDDELLDMIESEGVQLR